MMSRVFAKVVAGAILAFAGLVGAAQAAPGGAAAGALNLFKGSGSQTHPVQRSRGSDRGRGDRGRSRRRCRQIEQCKRNWRGKRKCKIVQICD